MNSPDIQRRLLLGSAVGAVALIPLHAAQADTSFTKFSFAATGAPTARTMPDRLSDIINVLDWGATGLVGDDQTSAIQNAINYCIDTKGGGIVYFPPGAYRISSGLVVGSNTKDVGVQLIGAGWGASAILWGTPTEFMISSGGLTYDCIERIAGLAVQANIAMPSGTGAVKLTRPYASCLGVSANGWYGIDASNCLGACLDSCLSSGPGHSTANVNNSDYNHGYGAAGSIGFQLGSGGRCTASRATSFDMAGCCKGEGASFENFSCEVNNIGFRLGWSSAGGATARGCSIVGLAGERLGIFVELYDCDGCDARDLTTTGSDNVMEPGPVSTMSWLGGTVTVTTNGVHNIPTSPSPIVLMLMVANMSAEGNGAWVPPTGEWIIATVTDSTHFTYPLAANPGAFNGAGAKNYWKYPKEYVIRCRKVYNTIVSGVQGSMAAAYAGTDLDYGFSIINNTTTSDPNVDYKNNVFETRTEIQGVILPSNSKKLAGWKFLQWTGVAHSPALLLTTVASPKGQMLFSDLPGQPMVSQAQMETDEYDIHDGAKSGGGVAAWNDQVQGGGTGHYKVRTDGANWFRVG